MDAMKDLEKLLQTVQATCCMCTACYCPCHSRQVPITFTSITARTQSKDCDRAELRPNIGDDKCVAKGWLTLSHNTMFGSTDHNKCGTAYHAILPPPEGDMAAWSDVLGVCFTSDCDPDL